MNLEFWKLRNFVISINIQQYHLMRWQHSSIFICLAILLFLLWTPIQFKQHFASSCSSISIPSTLKCSNVCFLSSKSFFSSIGSCKTLNSNGSNPSKMLLSHLDAAVPWFHSNRLVPLRGAGGLISTTQRVPLLHMPTSIVKFSSLICGRMRPRYERTFFSISSLFWARNGTYKDE